MPNAYDPYGDNATLPATRPNASFGAVTEYYSGSWSNYNGMIATLTSRVNWLSLQFNYAYGHALDTTSNGGFDAFGVNSVGQINPYDLTPELWKRGLRYASLHQRELCDHGSSLPWDSLCCG